MTPSIRTVIPLDSKIASLFPDNTVINSHYTVYNFIFLNLYEQFRRPVNFYFLIVTCLQFISIIAPVNPLSTLFPLLLAFSLTAVKEGYDDLKRHRQEATYNGKPRKIWDSQTLSWRTVKNSEIRVGDVIYLSKDDDIPCDVVVVAASSRNVFIRTDNLDGEIDLKPRDVLTPPHFKSSPLPSSATSSRNLWSSTKRRNREEADMMHFISMGDSGKVLNEKLSCISIDCPPPSSIIDCFDARATFSLPSTTGKSMKMEKSVNDSLSNRVVVPLTHTFLLPQSCRLKNTDELIAIAVYTGHETKFGMNKRVTPVKWAKIDQDVSKYSIFIFCAQVISAVIFGICGYLRNLNVQESYWYLESPEMDSVTYFLIYPLRFFLLSTVMIPISFKFVVDMSKYYMAMAVEWDIAMIHEPNAEGCRVKNSSILEDLGQIDYVLSDKTGTMTQNVMELVSIAVGPHQIHLSSKMPSTLTTSQSSIDPTLNAREGFPMSYPSQDPLRHYVSQPSQISLVMAMDVAARDPSVLHLCRVLCLCNNVEVIDENDEKRKKDMVPRGDKIRTEKVELLGREKGWEEAGNQNGEQTSQKKIKKSELSEEASTLIPILSPNVQETDLPVYRSASPDEEAMCNGVTRLNVRLLQREPNRACLLVNGNTEEWIIHHVFPFSSEKKSMGVVVENAQSGRIFFLVKGADDRVLQMSKPHTESGELGDAHTRQLVNHLSQYSRCGLRTLLVAQKELSRVELQNLMEQLQEAQVLVEKRAESLSLIQNEIETNLTLLGVTAIEDKLQDHVKETVQDFLEAGICVWMLTGDKVETAEQISLSCGLYRKGDRLIKITEKTKGDEDWVKILMSPTFFRPPSDPASNSNILELNPYFDQPNHPTLSGEKSGAVFPEETDSGDISSSEYIRRAADVEGIPVSANSHVPAWGVKPVFGSSDRMVLLVQGGHVLERILSDKVLSERFYTLSKHCISVICARTTPCQKAAITDFVRAQGQITLAVGDGGNDVAMLQVANVGVGISGKEGRQAARAADFSITQFSDLRSLVFVHGQQAYARTAYIIKYSFYKSMLIGFIQLAYNVAGTNVSGGTFWNSFDLVMWNGVYTLPQTLFYCLDRFAPRVVLEQVPSLYRLTRKSTDMNAKEFFIRYVLRGAVQSLVTLWLSTRIFGLHFAFADTGQSTSHDITYTVAYSSLIISQMFTMYLESHSVTALNALWILGMPLFYVFCTFVYNQIPYLQYFNVLNKTLNIYCVLAAFGIAVVLVAPSIVLLVIHRSLFPDSRDILRVIETYRQRSLMKLPEYAFPHTCWSWFLFFGTPEFPSIFLDQSTLLKEGTDAGDA